LQRKEAGLHRLPEKLDRSPEVGGGVVRGCDGVEENSRGVIHDGRKERFSILEVDVEGAAGVAGARADRIEAWCVQALFDEKLRTSSQKGLAGFELGAGSRLIRLFGFVLAHGSRRQKGIHPYQSYRTMPTGTRLVLRDWPTQRLGRHRTSQSRKIVRLTYEFVCEIREVAYELVCERDLAHPWRIRPMPVLENTTVPPTPEPSLLSVWVRHLLCFTLPLGTLLYTSMGPHSPWIALLTAGLSALLFLGDRHLGPERRQPSLAMDDRPFDRVLYALVALQAVNILMFLRMVSQGEFWSLSTFVGIFLVGGNSGYSAIVVAHELIHRSDRTMRQLGRFLLCTVTYEHFFTEHIRGHHVRVGTSADPATARFGETYNEFFARTVPGQFRSAWRLEAKRLGDVEMPWWDPRLLQSQVVQGVLAEAGLTIALFAIFGFAAGVAFLLQAFVAIRLLEAVNYFEHWGLQRETRQVRTIDSWDAESWFTLYSLVGLSRHADHHAHASRSYQKLRHFEESPKLPTGYFGMVLLVFYQNRRFQKLMTLELQRRKLGPFAEQGANEQIEAPWIAAEPRNDDVAGPPAFV
jgi:alkane 1-monooxygenase